MDRKALAEMFLRDIEDRPEDFYQRSQYTVTDSRTKRVWWVGNGAWGFGLYEPMDIRIGNGWFDRLGSRCLKAAHAWALNRLESTEPLHEAKIIKLKVVD